MKAYLLQRALLCGLALLASYSDAAAMAYGLVSFPDGTTAVVAQGRIELNEAGRLLAGLQLVARGGHAPRTLIISSPGGSMVGALHLGEIVRRLGLQTSVGRIAINSSGQREVTSGLCGSACMYVLMGGVSRTIRPGSVVAVHSPEISVTAGGRRYIIDPMTTRRVVRGTEPILRSYARHMGVDPNLISVAHGVPHHGARVLTPSEISRLGLVTTGTKRGPQKTSRRAVRHPAS